MEIIKDGITIEELKNLAQSKFGNFVKAVVDVEKGMMVVDAELHADEEAYLLEKGSQSKALWGINIYPGLKNEEWIEYDSMVNLKPAQGNRTRGIDDPEIREKIIKIVSGLVKQ